MATEEGTFPKIGNDPLFNSEINSFTDKKLASINSVNIIQSLLNSNTPFSGVNFKQDSQLSFQQAGSYWKKQGTVYYPSYVSGDYNQTIDEHNNSSIDTAIWDTFQGGLDSLGEDTQWMFMKSSTTNNTENGSIVTDENIFDRYGPVVRINFGSLHLVAGGGAVTTANFEVFLDDVNLTGATYNNTANSFDQSFGSLIIDLIRISGNSFIYRADEGLWSGASSTLGTGKLIFSLHLIGAVGDNPTGSILIDNEVFVSGLFNTQIQLSGTLPSGLYNYAIFNLNPGSSNELTGSDTSTDFSFNDGTNFVDFLGSQRLWTLNNNTGSEFIFRYKQTILHKASGLAQDTINNFGIMYGAT